MVDAVFEALLDRIEAAAYVLDLEGRFMYISHTIEKITGHRSDDLVGKPIGTIVFPRDNQILDQILNDSTGQAVRREIWLLGADSVLVKCSVTNLVTGSAVQGHSLGIIAKAQGTDPESEDKMRMFTMAVEQSPATVVITDRYGSIEYVNPKFSSLTGYNSNEVMGHNPRILKSGKQPPEFYKDLWETISSGREWRGEFHNLKKNGESYWESASISPIRGQSGEITHYVAVKEDITDRKKAEEEIRIREEILTKKNFEIERELKYAQFVVSDLLPKVAPQSDRLMVDFRYVSLEAIGGDFFSFNSLHDRGLGVFIGDVAGHGVAAALFLSLVRSATERLNSMLGTSPSRYIKDLNSDLTEGMVVLYLTALYGYFDFSSDNTRFRFAKGGHTPPVLYRAGEAAAQLLKSGGMPIGIFMDAKFQEIGVDLEPGDRIYLYTDGIIEARNEKQDMLEPEGLIGLVRRGGEMGLSESLDFILEETARFRGSGQAEDDIVIIGFEVM
jgi:sigma-B regulation protein RsbU (phosphoserine phosphatase)